MVAVAGSASPPSARWAGAVAEAIVAACATALRSRVDRRSNSRRASQSTMQAARPMQTSSRCQSCGASWARPARDDAPDDRPGRQVTGISGTEIVRVTGPAPCWTNGVGSAIHRA
jgi:hypothetical protein